MTTIKRLLDGIALLTLLVGFANAQSVSSTEQLENKTAIERQLTQHPKLSVTCQIFAIDFSLLSTKVKSYSTYDLTQCSDEKFAPFTSTSVGAQLKTLSPNSSFWLGGPYYQMADIDMSKVGSPFMDVGKLRFALNSRAKLDLLDVLMNPALLKSWWFKQIRYVPLPTQQELEMYWLKGSTVYELTSPLGDVYVMAWGTKLFQDQKNSINLSNLSQYLSLPEGWSFNIRTLDANLFVFVRQEIGYVYARVLDQLGNIYVQSPVR